MKILKFPCDSHEIANAPDSRSTWQHPTAVSNDSQETVTLTGLVLSLFNQSQPYCHTQSYPVNLTWEGHRAGTSRWAEQASSRIPKDCPPALHFWLGHTGTTKSSIFEARHSICIGSLRPWSFASLEWMGMNILAMFSSNFSKTAK